MKKFLVLLLSILIMTNFIACDFKTPTSIIKEVVDYFTNENDSLKDDLFDADEENDDWDFNSNNLGFSADDFVTRFDDFYDNYLYQSVKKYYDGNLYEYACSQIYTESDETLAYSILNTDTDYTDSGLIAFFDGSNTILVEDKYDENCINWITVRVYGNETTLLSILESSIYASNPLLDVTTILTSIEDVVTQSFTDEGYTYGNVNYTVEKEDDDCYDIDIKPAYL